MLEYLTNWFSGWEEYTTEPVDFIDRRDYVIAGLRQVGVASGTGIRVEYHFAHACKVSDARSSSGGGTGPWTKPSRPWRR